MKKKSSPELVMLRPTGDCQSDKTGGFLISILTRAQLALAGFQTSPATRAIASEGPSFLKSFVVVTILLIFSRLEVDESRG
jgi:hypothetical protein